MDKTVSDFYEKYPDKHKSYDAEHGGRLDYIVRVFGLDKIEGEKLLDIGGGYGFLFKRMSNNNRLAIIDGADIKEEELLCESSYSRANLNQDTLSPQHHFDRSFCFEVIEHLENPYNCIVQMKKATKIGGLIYLSVPDMCVTHNTPYPGLIYPHGNFEVFLRQMGLAIKRYNKYDQPHHAHLWECINQDWKDAQMLFPKHEAKFIGKTPVEYANL